MVALWVVVGVIIGAIIAIIAVELGRKKPEKPEPTTRYIEKWSVDSVSNPRIVAEYMLDATLPKNAKIVVKQCKNKNILKGLNVRYNPNVRGSFVIGDDRALILAGPFKDDEVAFITIERHLLMRLKDIFNELWERGVVPKDI
jgi:hypothetical protein